MPVLGEFTFEEGRIVFTGGETPALPPLGADGKPEPPDNPPRMIKKAGVALCDQPMVAGTLSASITFTETITPSTVCELVFGYYLPTQSHLGAGLGGGGALFSIRAWMSGAGAQQAGQRAEARWLDMQVLGDRQNLKPDVAYDVKVAVRGVDVILEVDGVQVAKATLPTPLNEPRQVGLFCLGEHDIIISNFKADVSRPKAFIVMQFSSPYNELYSHVIKDVCQEFSIEPIRADEIYGPGIIIKDVVDQIAESQVIIADISPPNPNVYFEVGYALALRKPIILLAQRRDPSERLPFDLSGFRVLFYDDTIGGKPKLEQGLRDHLKKLLGR